MSDNLVELYLKIIKDDEYFSDLSSKEDKIKGNISTLNYKHLKVDLKSKHANIILCNLEDLEKAATKEYDELKREHAKMVN